MRNLLHQSLGTETPLRAHCYAPVVMTGNGMNTALSRHHEREDIPQYLQQSAQLPSFRDIIPAHLRTTIDTQQQYHTSFEPQSEILTPITQPLSATSRSIASSPAQSQGSSMPSLTEGFEDVNVRGNDTMFVAQPQPMATMDRTSSWMPTSQYQGMSATYHTTTPRMSQLGSQQLSSRTSPSLPPLRDINQRTSAFDPTYGTSNAQMTYVTQAPTYPQMYSSAQSTTGDLDNTGFVPRTMSYDNTQYARFANSYPQTSRPYQATDYGRFSSSTYDPYRFNQSYRAYGDMGYSSHAMVGSQPASFGVPGDLSGAHNRRRRGNLPKPVTDILRSWFHDHLDHPYPTEEDKQMFIQKTGLTISQISNWFINARRRHWPALRQNRDRQRNNVSRRSNSAGGSI